MVRGRGRGEGRWGIVESGGQSQKVGFRRSDSGVKNGYMSTGLTELSAFVEKKGDF